MKLVSRHIIRQMSIVAVYALLALLALYSLLEVINEMGDAGKGSYTGAKMVQYVLMQIPVRVYELMPLDVLISGLIVLSQPASGSELTVIKASGMNMKRLLAVLSQFSLIFALATVVLGKWAAPDLSRRAENMKTSTINGRVSVGAPGL